MSTDHAPAPSPERSAATPLRSAGELFLISLLILFLELACIRWFPAHVLFLTFFTNTVLLACFLGMSLGCLAAGHRRNYLMATPFLLGFVLAAGQGMEFWRGNLEKVIDTHQASPQMVFFGTEYHAHDPTRTFVLPIEAVAGFFFVLIALVMVGPGQELGRALNRMPNRVLAYTVNILGSIVGIVLFAACSWWEGSPLWWFLPCLAAMGYFLIPRRQLLWVLLGVVPTATVWLASLTSGAFVPRHTEVAEHLWSPYYRIDYNHVDPPRFITTNLIGHQQMSSRETPFPAYALPYLLHRDAGGKPFEDVLIIGAGSGNDVSRALQWGATHVDAVEIDPVIQRLGEKYHPDRPYQDTAHVQVHLDDGRNFLRSTEQQYDLIVYALVDSLVLHSSYSNIRLESYLFTEQALQDVQRRLKPGGMFVMYNFFRQGWIVARLEKELQQTFGVAPLVLTLPYRKEVLDESWGGFTVFVSGSRDTLQPWRNAFAAQPEYWLDSRRAPGPKSPDGFAQPTTEERSAALREFRERLKKDEEASFGWNQFGLAQVVAPPEELRTATDDWPFLYLREPMIPNLSLRGMAIMGSLAVVLLLLFLPRRQGGRGRWAFDHQMFFLGAGFMLIETKAVVHMALLFGSTWMVNSVVFFAVLVMILAANLFVLLTRPQKLWPYYTGLLVTLVLNSAIPLDFFLGMSRTAQIAGSCLLVFAPILFAGVIFAVSFGRSKEPDRAFGANIAGAMLGGLAENTSMLLGFQYLVLVALAFYALSSLRFGLPVQEPKEALGEPALPPVGQVSDPA